MKCNTITLVGNMAADALYTPGKEGGSDRAWFRLGVDRKRQKETDFIPCVCWGKQAKAVADYTSQGKELTVVGELHVRSEKREDGTYDHYCEVNCEFVSFGRDSKKKQEADAAAQGAAPAAMGDAMSAKIAQIAAAAVAAELAKGQNQTAAAAGSDEDDNPFPEL